MNENLIITPADELRRIFSEEVEKLKGKGKKEVFSTKEAMNYLGVSRSTLHRWRDSGLLPYRKIEGSVKYTRGDLDNLLEKSANG